MINGEKLKNILKVLEENHINLFHSVSREEVNSYVSRMPNVNNLSEIEFDCEMLKLFALFKDAHTKFYVPWEFVDARLIYVQGKLYLDDDGIFKEVVSIGNNPTEQFLEKLSELMNYETEEWLAELIRKAVRNGYYFRMLGLVNENSFCCEVECEGQTETKVIEILPFEVVKEKGKLRKKLPAYEFKIIDDILHVRYRVCEEDKDLPFATFAEQMRKTVTEQDIRQFVLDIRGNNGGNSKIIKPFEELVAEKKLNGVLIINNGTFSSASIGVADFKKRFNSILIGEGTGAAAKSYGRNKNLQVEDKKFSVSTKLFDFSELFGYEGSIQPDLLVPVTIEDIRVQNDCQLNAAIEVLKGKK